MSDSRKDAGIRKGSLLLSTLVLTPDSALDAYRDKRIADPKITVEQLKRAREALDAIAFAIRSKNGANWRRLDEAWEILRKNQPPKDEPEPAAPTPPDIPGAPSPVSAPPAARESPPIAPAAPESRPFAQPPAPALEVPAPIPISYQPAPAPLAPPSFVVPHAPPLASDRPRVDVDATMEVSVVPIDSTLPFQGTKSAPGSALDDLEPLSHDDLDGTSALGVHLDLGDVLPFGEGPKPPPPPPSSSPEMTVEQYASLFAERQAQPERRPEIDRKYGVTDPAASLALDDRWQARFATDHALHQRFRNLVEQYVTWIRSKRPSP